MRNESESMREIHRIRQRMSRKWKAWSPDRIAAEISRQAQAVRTKFRLRIPFVESIATGTRGPK